MEDKALLEAIGQMMDSKLASERENMSWMMDSKLASERENMSQMMDSKLASERENMSWMMDSKLEPINERLDTLRSDVSDIKERLDSAEEHLAKVAVTQENLVLPKIDLLAEGHSEIIDKLKGLKDIESEQEEHDRRIWVLEQAIRAK